MAGNIVSKLAEQSQQNHERLEQIKAPQPQPVNAADVTNNLGQKLNMPSAGAQQSQVPDWREGLDETDKKIAEKNYNNLSQNKTDDFFGNFISNNIGRKIKSGDESERVWDSDVEAYRNWIELNYGDEQDEAAKEEKENRLKQLNELIAKKNAEMGQNGESEEPTAEGAGNPNGVTPTPGVEGTTPGVEGTTSKGGGSANAPTAEGEKPNATPAAPAEQDMTTFNYATGQPLPADASNKDIARTQAANRAGDNLWRLYQEYPNPTDEQIEAAIGSDAFAFNRVYGNKNDNWATAFGSGSFFGRVTNSQRAAVNEYINKRKGYEDNQKKAKDKAAEDAHYAQYEFTIGEGENAKPVKVTEEISYRIKNIGNTYANLVQQDEELQNSAAGVQATADQLGRVGVKGVSGAPAPDRTEIKAKRQKAIGELREQLAAAGIDLGAAPEDGEFETIEDLIASAPDYETEKAIMKAIGLAQQYTPYKPEEDTRSFEERMADRQKRKEEIDLQTRNRELERARNRASFADLAATIGDMTRASQGGRVDPRDWQQIYDNLTAQERANVDNYRTRMQKIEDDIKQQRMQEKQLAAARQAQTEKQQHEKEMQRTNLGWEETKQNRDLAAKLALQQAKDAAAQNRAKISAKGSGSGGSRSNVLAFGKFYDIPKSASQDTMVTVAGMLQRMGVSLGIKNDIVGVDQANTAATRGRIALQKLEKNSDGSAHLVLKNRDIGVTSGDSEAIVTDKILSKTEVDEIENYLDKVAKTKSGPEYSYEYNKQGNENENFDREDPSTWFE